MSQPVGQRILIVRLSAIGDVLVTTPVSRALREAFPDAWLAWVVERRAAEILEGNPYLDAVIPWDRRKGGLRPNELLAVARDLRRHRFDVAIDFQGLLRSALVARLSGARTVIGNTPAKEGAARLYHTRLPKSTTELSSRQRCLDLLRPLGVASEDRRMVFPVGDADREAARALLQSGGLGPGQPYACLVPGTTWPQKHWLDESWGQLAVRLRERLGLLPVVLGGPGDVDRVERVRADAGSGPLISAAGRTSLKAAGALLEGAALTVAVDTALMHASVALGTPTIGLCGASWWPGFQDYDRFAVVREPLPCSPCLHRPTCGGRFDCMRALTAPRVVEVARRLLAGELPAASAAAGGAS